MCNVVVVFVADLFEDLADLLIGLSVTERANGGGTRVDNSCEGLWPEQG